MKKLKFDKRHTLGVYKDIRKRSKKPVRLNKRPHKSSYKTLKDKAWKTFSLWVRTNTCPGPGKDWNRCVTCNRDFLVKNLNAGHFIHGHSKKTFFDERNVWPQCVRCNKWLHGNMANYQLFMESRFSDEEIAELHKLSGPAYRWTRDELESIIKKYEI